MSYEKILTNLALSDERYVVLTAENRAVVRNMPAVLKDRFIDFGITEQCMIGAAAGLALRGRIPVVHALATFLILRAYEFIRTDIGIAGLPVKLSGWIPGILSDANGPTHQALEDISLMRGIPGVQVFAPSDEEDMLLMLPTIWASPFPTYLRVNVMKPVLAHRQAFEIGKAEIISKGSEVCILSYGALFGQAFDAYQRLNESGIDIGLINMRSLDPVDEMAILEAAESSLLVIVEDHFMTGGLYSIVAEVLLKHGTTAQILHLGFGDNWFKPALLPAVLDYHQLTGEHLAERIMQELYKRGINHAVLQNLEVLKGAF